MSSQAGRTLVLSLVAALALSTFVPGEALAVKMRAVRPSKPSAPATGPCHTYGFIPAGLKASYKTSQSGQADVTFTVTYVSDNAAQTKTTQKVSVPGIGLADATTTIDLETVAGLRAVKHVEVKATITSPIKFTSEVDIDYVPSMTWGPAQSWCRGAKWTVPATTQTMVVNTGFGAPTTTITTTVSQSGEVLAVNEPITVAAGTFNTVKYRGMVTTDTGASPAIVWLSMTHPIIVRQQALDAAGNVTQTTELTALTGASLTPSRMSIDRND